MQDAVGSLLAVWPFHCLLLGQSDTDPVLSVQGMGKQNIGSKINVLGQILVGLPSALLLAFWLKLGVEGLVIGVSPKHIIC